VRAREEFHLVRPVREVKREARAIVRSQIDVMEY